MKKGTVPALCLLLATLCACGNENSISEVTTEAVIENSISEVTTEAVTENSVSEATLEVSLENEYDEKLESFVSLFNEKIKDADYKVTYETLPNKYYICNPSLDTAYYDGASYIYCENGCQWSFVDGGLMDGNHLSYILSEPQNGFFTRLSVEFTDETNNETRVLREYDNDPEFFEKLKGDLETKADEIGHSASQTAYASWDSVENPIETYALNVSKEDYQDDFHFIWYSMEDKQDVTALLRIYSEDHLVGEIVSDMICPDIDDKYALFIYNFEGSLIYYTGDGIDDISISYNEYGLETEYEDAVSMYRYNYIYTDSEPVDADLITALNGMGASLFTEEELKLLDDIQ